MFISVGVSCRFSYSVVCDFYVSAYFIFSDISMKLDRTWGCFMLWVNGRDFSLYRNRFCTVYGIIITLIIFAVP